MLLEKTAELGGTVRRALIHTIGGLFDDQGDFLNEGLPVELTRRLEHACPHTQKRRIGKTWVLNVDPAVYAEVITDWITTTPGIEVFHRASVTQFSRTGGYITQIAGTCCDQTYAFSLRALVDTTGDASVVRQIDKDLVAEGQALAGFIVQLRGVPADTMAFPRSVALATQIRRAVGNEKLPPECSSLWLDKGVYPDEVYAKFSVSPQAFDATHMRDVAQRLIGFLQSLPDLAGVFIHRYGELGTRDAGRIRGEYRLTEQDLKEGKQFADAACKASWPIEHWHPEKGLSLEYLPPGCFYEIPLRCLKVAGFDNLWAAGKCLSAEPRAQASARVAGSCWAMGQALGRHLNG